MPRKPNYDFERREREKVRAAKKAAKLAAKREKVEERKTADEAGVDDSERQPRED